MDLSKAKCVGKLPSGEPVYEISDSVINEQSSQRRAHTRFEDCGREDCLVCILNEFIEPTEDLERYIEVMAQRIREIDAMKIASEDTNEVQMRRQWMLRRLTLASACIAHFKGCLLGAAEFFEQEDFID